MAEHMIFGMTRSEIGMVVFIFVLVYVVGLLPRVAERLGALIAGRRG